MIFVHAKNRFVQSAGITGMLLLGSIPAHANTYIDNEPPNLRTLLFAVLMQVVIFFPAIVFFYGAILLIRHIHDTHLRSRGIHKISLGFPALFFYGFFLFYTPFLVLLPRGQYSFSLIPFAQVYWTVVGTISFLFALILFIRGMYLWIKYKNTDVLLKKRGRMKVFFGLYSSTIILFVWTTIERMMYFL